MVCFVSAGGLRSVCRVFDVERKSKSGALICLPESHLQRRHRTLPLLHEIRGQNLSLLLCINTAPRHMSCFSVWGYVNIIDHSFPQLSQLVQSAVENNSLTIEPVAMSALPMVKASAVECGGPKWVIMFAYQLSSWLLFPHSLLNNG